MKRDLKCLKAIVSAAAGIEKDVKHKLQEAGKRGRSL